jgi:hypothetical protein
MSSQPKKFVEQDQHIAKSLDKQALKIDEENPLAAFWLMKVDLC